MPYRSPGPRWIAPAFAVTVVAYLAASVTSAPTSTVTALKPLPVLVLAAGLWATAPRTRHRLLVLVGLVACATGDVLLERDFIAGLVAFLVGHLVYLVAFVAIDRRPSPGTAGLVAVWISGLLVVVWDGLGDMTVPVVTYAVVIGVMMWRAGSLLGSQLPRPASVATALGAVSFGVSDSLIALDRFAGAVPHAAWWVMSTYWVAQALIARGAHNSDRWALAAPPPTPEDFAPPDEAD